MRSCFITRVGRNHLYIRCLYGIFGRESTKYTVVYGVYIQVLANPTHPYCIAGHTKQFQRYTPGELVKVALISLNTDNMRTNTHTSTHNTYTHTYTHMYTCTHTHTCLNSLVLWASVVLKRLCCCTTKSACPQTHVHLLKLTSTVWCTGAAVQGKHMHTNTHAPTQTVPRSLVHWASVVRGQLCCCTRGCVLLRPQCGLCPDLCQRLWGELCVASLHWNTRRCVRRCLCMCRV